MSYIILIGSCVYRIISKIRMRHGYQRVIQLWMITLCTKVCNHNISLIYSYAMCFCALTSTNIYNGLSFSILTELPKDEDLPTVPYAHPDVHEAFMSGEQQPKGHPSVSALVSILQCRHRIDLSSQAFQSLTYTSLVSSISLF